MVDRLRAAGAGPEEIIENTVTATLWEVGELWERGEVGVGQEHLATAVCERIVHYVFPPAVSDLDGTRRILMVSAPGNRHSLGPRIVSHILESRKYLVDYLPGETPVDEMVAFAELTRPRVVGISLCVDQQVDGVRDLVQRLRGVLPRVKTMVGGFVRDKKTLAGRCGADASPATMEEAFSVLEGWLSPVERTLGEEVFPALLWSTESSARKDPRSEG